MISLNTLQQKTGCLVCGSELVYLKNDELINCIYCGNEFNANVKCRNGHFVCDSCHSLPANDIIEQFCMSSDSTSPLKMAVELMHNQKIKMHGPEHHFLVPAVLLAAYCNATEQKVLKSIWLKKAKTRAEKVLGGFCGTHGSCGAAVGTGIYISIISNATALSTDEWKFSNLMTSKALYNIAMSGGPRCCKRDSYIAIEEAIYFTKENFGTELSILNKIVCDFSSLNKECLKENCKYYKK